MDNNGDGLSAEGLLVQGWYRDGIKRGEMAPRRTKLWASDAGRCHRRAMFHVLAYEVTHPFAVEAQEYMELGNAYEANTLDALWKVLGTRMVAKDGLWLSYGDWTARADAIVDMATPNAMIIELKASGDKWWDYKGKLPQADHLCQLGMYGWLYEQLQKRVPALRLVYRAWGHWAEFEVEVEAERIVARGTVDGDVRARPIQINLEAERAELERLYRAGKVPDLPDAMLDECQFQDKPGCLYYGHCWGR